MLKDIFKTYLLYLFFKLIIKNRLPTLIKITSTGLGYNLIKEIPMRNIPR